MASLLSVGDCLQLAKLVYEVFDACRDDKGASAEYVELKNEVSAMETALQELEWTIANDTLRQRVSGSGEKSSEEKIGEMIENCRVTLDKVRKTLSRYSDLGVEGGEDAAGAVAREGEVGQEVVAGTSATSEKPLARTPTSSWPWLRLSSTNSTLLPKPSTTTTPDIRQEQTLARHHDQPKKSNSWSTGGLLSGLKRTKQKFLFATREQEELAKLTDRLKVHTACLQLFLTALNR
ncbi:hypothetical protein BJ508DRAFT_170154 [Ascobolus immersus RN42]|uniref:Fungal N-terminal domain-containing protein n=1 Tax=Ascobolus immersus RN42 TaxID=1160509 RepID=A0A3N4HY49_ASCIM|nr:hypothetical protein BJ508DRAFT_170154 [Ascobolus immersus RN42]